MRVDYSNGAEIIAKISINGEEYIFDAQNENAISDFLYGEIGEVLHETSRVPLFIEASSWCVLAGVGDTFETGYFEISIEVTDNKL